MPFDQWRGLGLLRQFVYRAVRKYLVCANQDSLKPQSTDSLATVTPIQSYNVYTILYLSENESSTTLNAQLLGPSQLYPTASQDSTHILPRLMDRVPPRLQNQKRQLLVPLHGILGAQPHLLSLRIRNPQKPRRRPLRHLDRAFR